MGQILYTGIFELVYLSFTLSVLLQTAAWLGGYLRTDAVFVLFR